MAATEQTEQTVLERLVEEARQVGVDDKIIKAVIQLEEMANSLGIPSLREAIRLAKQNIDYVGLFMRLNNDIAEPLYNVLAEARNRLSQFEETHRIKLVIDTDAAFADDIEDGIDPMSLLFSKSKRSRNSASGTRSTSASSGQGIGNSDIIALAKALIAKDGSEPEVSLRIGGDDNNMKRGTLQEDGQVLDDQDGKLYLTVSKWQRNYLKGGNPYANVKIMNGGEPEMISDVVEKARKEGWMTSNAASSNGHEASMDLSDLEDESDSEGDEGEEEAEEEAKEEEPAPPPVVAQRAAAPAPKRRIPATTGKRA